MQENILTADYLKTVEFKNHLYSKTYDTIIEVTSYQYESELWKNNKMTGRFNASTYVYPKSDLNDMDEYFSFHIAGYDFEASISPNFRYEKTYEIKLPYRKYQIIKAFKNDTLNIGLAFHILKENKIIFTTVMTNDKFELEIEKLIQKLNEI
ncbi:hypothetical protein [Maribacter arcticus]|uniref:Uncharacterized protein n=1 Tax=Maribacter arcticus TaxID=561365 RepID=A0A1T5ECC0_9FLAO|nr:hypothetical protein [Maribacter arcticus]SKB81604.1 hypothetical protein SAMN05660866_03417 [Maribacter arcticus]